MKWLALAILLIAGCAEPQVEETLSAEKGAIAGVTADGSLRPISARITLQGEGTELETVSDEAGLFQFSDLPPGSYNLIAGLEGYKDTLEVVQVVAGDVTDGIAIVLQWDPTFVTPFALEPVVFDGFIECSGVVTTPDNPAVGEQHVAVAACDLPSEAGVQVVQDRFMTTFPIDTQPTFVQLELVWTPSQDASRSLLFEGLQADRFCEDPSGCLGLFDRVHGQSTLVLRLDSSYLGQIGSTHDVAVRVFPYTEEPAPAGVVVQQSFQVFATFFFGYEPPVEWLYTETLELPDP